MEIQRAIWPKVRAELVKRAREEATPVGRWLTLPPTLLICQIRPSLPMQDYPQIAVGAYELAKSWSVYAIDRLAHDPLNSWAGFMLSGVEMWIGAGGHANANAYIGTRPLSLNRDFGGPLSGDPLDLTVLEYELAISLQAASLLRRPGRLHLLVRPLFTEADLVAPAPPTEPVVTPPWSLEQQSDSFRNLLPGDRWRRLRDILSASVSQAPAPEAAPLQEGSSK